MSTTSAVPEYRFHDTRRWRFDYAFVDKKIAVEYEGGVFIRGRHTRPTGFIKDVEKYNAACMLGWRLYRVTVATKIDKMIKDFKELGLMQVKQLRN